jgi:hypothetical protein
MQCPTVKIKATDPEQGEFVVINEADFDPKKQTLYVEPVADEEPAADKANKKHTGYK